MVRISAVDAWLVSSARALAALVRSGKARSEDVVTAHVEHARRVNPRVNAIVADRYDDALAEAREVDARIAKGEVDRLAPFAGVPCTIKEAFGLRGMPNTAGLVSRKGRLATRDAITVARLRGAGAIPIGVTNVSELCMWMESSNRVYGRTSSAYDSARIAGGSSGGEGSIVGTGASPFGLGSDIGGSIRMPAFFNGVFGHKASSGTVPSTGQFPIAHGDALKLLATGPICRRAEDLWPLLQILAGPDGEDTTCTTPLVGSPDDVEVRGLTVLVVEDNGRIAVDASLKDAQARAARALEARGARVRLFKSPLFAKSLELWADRMAKAGGPTFAALMGGGEAVDAWRELGLWLRGKSEHTIPAIGLALLEKLPQHFPHAMGAVGSLGHDMRRTVEDALGPHGVILYPPYPRTAPKHDSPLFFPVEWMYTALWNALELPVTQVPCGLDKHGLPLGVQVVGKHGADAVTIAVARVLEDELGGWVPPPRFFPGGYFV
jgi:fatty acid amide hydrolase 2